MFFQLTCTIVDQDESNRGEMSQFLAAQGMTPMASLGTLDQLNQFLKSDKPQLAIVNLDPGAMDQLRVLAPLIRNYPDTTFFVMSQVMDPNLLMDAMHVGVKEFIPLPIVEHRFKAALDRVANSHGMSANGKIITVVPTMGGVGSTTIACNVATCLAQKAKTVLVDLDLVQGGVASAFDLHPKYTIADVMLSGEQIDRQLLDTALAVHPKSGLAVLARPELPEDSQRVNQMGLTRLLGVLGRMFDYVVVDSVMSIDPLYATALHSSTINMIVMQLNVPSAKNAERFVGTLRRMGVDTNKIKVVVNRYVKKGWDIDPEEVEKSLGLKLSWMVPNDYKNAIAAVNFGEPVVLRAPRSDMSVSLLELAGMINAPVGVAKAA
jgi:pilus assembly protein CpaE